MGDSERQSLLKNEENTSMYTSAATTAGGGAGAGSQPQVAGDVGVTSSQQPQQTEGK